MGQTMACLSLEVKVPGSRYTKQDRLKSCCSRLPDPYIESSSNEWHYPRTRPAHTGNGILGILLSLVTGTGLVSEATTGALEDIRHSVRYETQDGLFGVFGAGDNEWP